MRKLLLLSVTLGAGLLAHAQNQKNYRLTVVAEGNFGTPNGDLFQVERQAEATAVNGPLYQNANGLTAGIDVLQDFDHWQTKAVLCGKGAHPTKLAVVHYPAMDTVFTVSSGLGAGIQRCGMASDNIAYIFTASPGAVRYVNIASQTVSPVADPGGHITSGVHSMIGYNGTMYVANATKVVTIDTLTQSATGAIVTGLTAINTMVKDTVNNCLWLLGKVGVTNAIAKIEVNNNNTVSAPVMLTGFTNAKLLRVGPGKLYFVSGTGFYIYDLTTQSVPATPVYTSSFTGFAVIYDRSFAVDPVSGDFAYTTAAAYVAPGLFEVVDGTSYSRIDSGAITGAAIPNELFLTTWTGGQPALWDTTSLTSLYAECDISLVAPTANFGTTTVTGTTGQMAFNDQGSYIIEWKFVSGNDSVVQFQQLTIADTTAPVADSAQLTDLAGSCPFTLIPPTASDNCDGTIAGTTDSLTFNTAGSYTITWTYADSSGNISTQTQQLEVVCGASGMPKQAELSANIYPNPAQTKVSIDLQENDHYHVRMINAFGQVALTQSATNRTFELDIAKLPEGMYVLSITNAKGARRQQKILIKH